LALARFSERDDRDCRKIAVTLTDEHEAGATTPLLAPPGRPTANAASRSRRRSGARDNKGTADSSRVAAALRNDKELIFR